MLTALVLSYHNFLGISYALNPYSQREEGMGFSGDVHWAGLGLGEAQQRSNLNLGSWKGSSVIIGLKNRPELLEQGGEGWSWWRLTYCRGLGEKARAGHRPQQQGMTKGLGSTSRASQQVEKAEIKESGIDWSSWAVTEVRSSQLVGYNNRNSGSWANQSRRWVITTEKKTLGTRCLGRGRKFLELNSRIGSCFCFPGGWDGKESACNAGDSLGKDPWEQEMATHSSILSRRIPWMWEPGGL